ncbi:MAG: HNH endonuclease [Clostridia bacterium]|nr:HNH endonuclease [Clostridia bacterium]
MDGKATPAEEVHHIKPLSAGGKPYTFSYLRSPCRSYHLKEHHRLGGR